MQNIAQYKYDQSITKFTSVNQIQGYKNGPNINRKYSVRKDDWEYTASQELSLEGAIWRLDNLLFQDKYKQAVALGETYRPEFPGLSQVGCPLIQITVAKFYVRFAKALIYTGATERGINLINEVIAHLEGERNPEEAAWNGDWYSPENCERNRVLGEAHNLLGYVHWMESGRYEDALQEFRAALQYFRAAGLEADVATVEDNTGRVYTLLRQFNEARRFIISGLNRRLKAKDEYRVALSYNSIAIYYLQKGNLDKALKEVKVALAISEEGQRQRGIGLACITIARTLRRFGDRESLSQAETYLKRAAEIFEQRVYEPIRLIEVYIELGCTYQDKMILASQDTGYDLPDKERYLQSAILHLEGATTIIGGRTPRLYHLACEKLASIYAQSGQLDEAEQWSKRAEQAILSSVTAKEGDKSSQKQMKPFQTLQECFERS